MPSMKANNLEKRAKTLIKMLNEKIKCDSCNIEIVDGYSEVGGGSLPLERIPTKCISIDFGEKNITGFERALREFRIPIISRVYKNKLYLDLRTIREEEYDIVVEGIEYGIERMKGCI